MAVIPESQLLLMRKQREFKRYLDARDWQALANLEKELASLLDVAVSDPQRSAKDLLKQMSLITELYKELSIACHTRHQQLQQ